MRKLLIVIAVLGLVVISASVGAVFLNGTGEQTGAVRTAETRHPDELSARSSSQERAFLPQHAEPATAPGAVDAEGQVDTPGTTGLPPLGDKIIKTGEISVRVGDGEFTEKANAVRRTAEDLGGFVTASTSTESDGRVISGTIVIRVPSDKFEAALSAIKGLGEVTAESTSGRDVTAEFVDLEARLRHLRSQEQFYLRLMDRAETISDMIQIQSQLSQIQLQIEQIQGRLEQLKDQTSFSTITVRLFEPGAPIVRDPGLGQAWRQAVANFKSVIGGIIMAAGWLAPLALLGFVGFGVWRVLRPKMA